MYLAKIKITLRKSILDPQGKAIEHAVHSLNIADISDVRIGKYIELKVAEADELLARNSVQTICTRLLANGVMEDFDFELEKITK